MRCLFPIPFPPWRRLGSHVYELTPEAFGYLALRIMLFFLAAMVVNRLSRFKLSETELRAKRDYAMLAMLFGCGFRRSELVGLELDEVQMRQGHWAVVDLIGKGAHIRTVPIPNWVKAALDQFDLLGRSAVGIP